MSTKFMLDENIPYALIDLLERRGFSVQHLKKIGKQGIKNGEVYEIAERENMWIVTRDQWPGADLKIKSARREGVLYRQVLPLRKNRRG